MFNVLGISSVTTKIPPAHRNECLSVQNLRETLNLVNNIEVKNESDISTLQEAWNDALKFKDDSFSAFRLGYIDLLERAIAEKLTLACAKALIKKLPKDKVIPEDLRELNQTVAETYYANISIFRSAPDTWAIDQLFPIMPIHRLKEKPTQLGHFADLTCDSDGKLNNFIDNGKPKSLLELHTLNPNEDYWIGMFLGGAYQEVMGNLHNLFGSTNSIHIRLANNGGYTLDHVIRGNTKGEVLPAMEDE